MPGVNDIHLQNINNIRNLSEGHPVYIGDGPGGISVVMKGESYQGLSKNDARFTISYMADMYKNATDGMADIRILDAGEVAMLATRIPNWAASPDLKNLVWYKMSCLRNLHTLKKAFAFMRNPGEAIKPKYARVISLIQRNPAMMRNLGKIFVVDCFVANSDRFSVYIDDNRKYSWRVINAGNVFVTTDDTYQNGFFCGVDFFDNNSLYKDLLKDINLIIASLAGQPDAEWTGDFLMRGKEKIRDVIAQQLIDFMNNPTKGFGGLTNKHREEFRKGITDGRTLLKNHLDGLKKKNSLPPGILSRMKRIGW